MPALHQKIRAIVARIPRGVVATYGQVAWLAGAPRCARQVGLALRSGEGGPALPWHRVVNARGEIRVPGAAAREQRRRLAAEGVRFRANGSVDLARFAWKVTVRATR